MTQPRPYRLRVLDRLTETLKSITPANGYYHDMSKAVFRGRTVYGDNEILPMISILEPPIPLDQIWSNGPNPNNAGTWELLIQGFVKDDHDNPTDPAHMLMADVKTALVGAKLMTDAQTGRKRNILGMGASITEMIIGQGSVRPADEISARAFFWLTLSLNITEDLENPYS